MKKFVVAFMMLTLAMNVLAQSLTVTSCKLLRNDLRARTQKRMDANQQPCALILVEVVGVKNLEFKEKVGDVKYAYNQYEVYVPAGTETLNYSNDEYSGQVKLSDDFGLDIESLCTYRLDFKGSNNMHSATFYVLPVNASFTFDGKKVELDSDGTVCMECSVGKHDYTVSSPGYESFTGSVELTDDEANEVTEISLEQISHTVNLNCNMAEALLFVDDKPYGAVKNLSSDFRLSEGQHRYRFTLEGYNDVEGVVNVFADDVSIDVSMNEIKGKTVVHKEERSRSVVNIRGFGTAELSGLAFLDDFPNSYQIRAHVSANTNFAGIFTFRYVDFGVSAGILSDDVVDDYNANEPSEDNLPVNLEDAMQLGIILPLTKYNNCFFTALGGMYGSYWTFWKVSSDDNDAFEGGFWDYGLRLSASLVFNKFVLGAEFNKSFNYDNISSFGISLGYKFTL